MYDIEKRIDPDVTEDEEQLILVGFPHIFEAVLYDDGSFQGDLVLLGFWQVSASTFGLVMFLLVRYRAKILSLLNIGVKD